MDLGITMGLVIAACCCFILLIVAAISYVRAANMLIKYLKTEMPGNWKALIADDPLRPPGASNMGEAVDVRQLILGIKHLSPEDVQSGRLLWIARRRIILCAILLAAPVIATGAAFQVHGMVHF